MFGLTGKETQIILTGPKSFARALRILQYVASRPNGVTCEECTQALDLTHQTCSPRFSALERAKCLVPTGKVKKTSAGSKARLMRVSPSADFRVFLVQAKRRAPVYTQTKREAALIAACEELLTQWKKPESREEALRNFVTQALKIDARNIPAGVTVPKEIVPHV